MIPALMIMLIVMLCGFLPALNIVGEKEVGTIEQINVSPISQLTFYARQDFTLLDYRVHSLNHKHRNRVAGLWVDTRWQPDYHIYGHGTVYHSHVEHGSGIRQFFTEYAAGHVRNVLFCYGVHPDERIDDTGSVDAVMGPGGDLLYTATLLCRHHACHLSPRSLDSRPDVLLFHARPLRLLFTAVAIFTYKKQN